MKRVRKYRSIGAYAACGLIGLPLLIGDLGATPIWAGTHKEVRSTFDQAMARPLAERVSQLNVLDQQLERQLFQGVVRGESRVDLQWTRFRVKQELAKYPEAAEVFGQYAEDVRRAFPAPQGTAILERVVTRLSPRANPDLCLPLLSSALTKLASEDPARPFLLLQQAQCMEQLPGRRAEGIATLKELIGQHPESVHRPAGMRLLARLQIMTADDKACFQTLELMQQQLSGTWYEQWAHIFSASLWENRRGEPQRALSIYQESLKRFPDHHFAGYVRGEIERLQGVIERQLIDDALEGIAREEGEIPRQAREPADDGHEHNPIVTTALAER